jgi:hypothetical protein
MSESTTTKSPSRLARLRTGSGRRLVLLAGAVLAAVLLGFVLPAPDQAQLVIHRYGYPVMLLTFAWFCWSLARVWRGLRAESRAASPGAAPWWPTRLQLAAVGGACLLALIAEPRGEKILYDEYVLGATAMHIHQTRDISTVVRGYEVNGVFLPLTSYLDKRPYFFAFVLSLVHDVTGYREANVYLLNAGSAVAVLVLTFVVARRLAGGRAASLAVLLVGGLPLLAQNASGAGMELINLAMLLLCLWLGCVAAERPTEARMEAFVLAIVLLAQCRYESALYVVPGAMVILLLWWRERRLILPWGIVAAPLLLLPIPLLQLVLTANKALWELPENLESRFAPANVGPNLKHAADFLFSGARADANSPLLALLGCAGLAGCAWLALRRPRAAWRQPARWVTACFSLGIFGNLGLLMFYFWGALDDPMVARLALPLYVLLACAAAAWLAHLDRARPVLRWGIAAALAAIPVTYGRTTPLHLYSSENLVAAEVRWERAWVAARPAGDRLVLTNKSSLPWLLEHIPSLLFHHARERRDQIAFHLREGTFTEVLVTQRLRPTSPGGGFALDPEDRLPEEFQLEPLVEKRFGATLDRISRLRAIAPPSAAPAP